MRYNTFTRVIYIHYKSLFDRSSAAGLALMLIALTLFVLFLEQWTRGKGRYDSGTTAGGRKPEIIRLGRWQIFAFLFCLGVSLLALFIPVGVLGYWLVRGMAAGEQIQALGIESWNSMLVSGLAAALTLGAAIPVVILNVRRPSWMSIMVERITYMGYALPGIVIALALVFFGANYALPLYQTLPLLLLAYLILFLPQAVGAVRTSLLQIDPKLEEAARTLGSKPMRVFRRITLPLLSPGLWAAAALVFLTTMKELPATLILSPFGFQTLATSVWSAVSEAFFAQAAAPALLLILGSSLPLAIMMLKERT